MNKVIMAMIVVFAVGCASTPEEKGTGGDTAPQTKETSPSDAATSDTKDDSRVLSKAKKCPKKSILVNGKCTLQVESAD